MKYQRLKFDLFTLLKAMWNEYGIPIGGITTGQRGLKQETMRRQFLKEKFYLVLKKFWTDFHHRFSSVFQQKSDDHVLSFIFWRLSFERASLSRWVGRGQLLHFSLPKPTAGYSVCVIISQGLVMLSIFNLIVIQILLLMLNNQN